MTKQSKTALELSGVVIGAGVVAAFGAGQPAFGAILIALGVLLAVADYLYGKYNRGEDLVLPAGIDEETARDVAKELQEQGPEVVEDVRDFLKSNR